MPPSNTAAMFMGTGVYLDNDHSHNRSHNRNYNTENKMHQSNILSSSFGQKAKAREPQMWPSGLDVDCGCGSSGFEDPNDDSVFWAPSLSLSLPRPSPTTRALNSNIADLWPQQQQHHHYQNQQPRHSLLSTAAWQPRTLDAYDSMPSPAQRHSLPSPMPAKSYLIPRASLPADKMAIYRDPTQSAQQHGHCLPSPPMASGGVYFSSPGISPTAWSFYQQQNTGGLNNDLRSGHGMGTHKQALSAATPLPRHALGQRDSNSLFAASLQFPRAAFEQNQPAQDAQLQLQLQLQEKTTTNTPAAAKTFKPMQMVHRERNRRASASSTGTSSSGGGGGSSNFSPAISPYICSEPGFSYYAPPTTTLPTSTNPHAQVQVQVQVQEQEQAFRRRQGISLNYRGDIHNPHNRGDHVPAHANTSLFLMGLPPNTSVGDLLRAIARLGPTGRIFAASVNPPDPMRRLPLAAAKISYFTRAQAEHLKALVDARQLVMFADQLSGQFSNAFPAQSPSSSPGTPHVVRCAWNRDKKAPRRCVQASECRVLRIRGPRSVVNFGSLREYFEEKFRYELQDVQVVNNSKDVQVVNNNNSSSSSDDNDNNNDNNDDDETTMEWRFASFQSQAIAAKMALNQERKMVRVEYGRDPCEWGEF